MWFVFDNVFCWHVPYHCLVLVESLISGSMVTTYSCHHPSHSGVCSLRLKLFGCQCPPVSVINRWTATMLEFILITLQWLSINSSKSSEDGSICFHCSLHTADTHRYIYEHISFLCLHRCSHTNTRKMYSCMHIFCTFHWWCSFPLSWSDD